jgi:4-hydroxybenzoate polyprenyltransferase
VKDNYNKNMSEKKSILKDNNEENSFFKRFYEYQKERFPVFQYIIYIFLYYFGFFILSSYIAYKSISFSRINIVGLISVFLVFFELRLFDEIKDYSIDLKYSPERPVQRGLISINEVKKMLSGVIAIIFIINSFYGLQNIVLILVTQCFIIIMAKEFFMGEKLKKNRILYAMLHMVVMALISLYIISHAITIDMLNIRYYSIIAISYLIGFIIEVGRKIEAPEDEIFGVDNYSKLFGPKKAAFLLFSLALSNSILTFLMLIQLKHIAAILTLFLPLIVLMGVINFINNMNKKNSVIMNFSGIIYNLLIFIIFATSCFWK